MYRNLVLTGIKSLYPDCPVDFTFYPQTLLFVQHKFYFDQVFGEHCSNEEVYQRTAYPLVRHMLNG